MINLLKMYFYKVFRSMPFWIITALCVGLTSFMSAVSFEGRKKLYLKFATEYGSSYSTDFWAQLSLTLIVLMFLVGIFAILFVSSDFSNGTIKNIAARGYSREVIYFSELITVLCVFIFNMAASSLSSFIIAKVIIGDVIPNFFAVNSDSLTFIGIFMLQVIAYISIAFLAAMLFRSTGSPIAVFLGILLLEPIIVNLINKFISGILHIEDFLINPYTIGGAAIQGASQTSVIVLLVYIVLANVVGLLAFKKRDIN